MPENYLQQNQGNLDENWVSARAIFEKLKKDGKIGETTKFTDWVKSLKIPENCLFREKTKKAKVGETTSKFDFFLDPKYAKSLMVQRIEEVRKTTIQFNEKASEFLQSDEAILKRAFEILQKKVEEFEPKAKLLDAREANLSNLKGLRETYWALKAEIRFFPFSGERDFINFLKQEAILYRNGRGELRPYAKVSEFFELKPIALENGREVHELKVNQKGYHKLFQILSNEESKEEF